MNIGTLQNYLFHKYGRIQIVKAQKVSENPSCPFGISRLFIAIDGEQYMIARFRGDEPVGKFHRSDFIFNLNQPIEIYTDVGIIRMFAKYIDNPSPEEEVSDPEMDSN